MKTRGDFLGVAARPFLLAAAALGLLIPNSRAQISLAPGDNSSIQVTAGGPDAGVTDWIVDGNNILNPDVLGRSGLQWFYYSTTGLPTAIQNDATAAPVSTTPTGLSPDSASFGTTYTHANFSLQAVYTLTGGPVNSGNSDLQETITVKNTTANTLSFRFFQYASFTIPNSTVSLYPVDARGTPLYYLAQVNGGGVSLSEYVDGTLNPGANGGTIIPPAISVLTSSPGFQLTGTPTATSGPGGAWLLEWDVNIPVNGSFILSKDLNVTGITPAPEPATLSLVALGLIGLGAFRRHRRRFAA